jgi:hypothetical protein
MSGLKQASELQTETASSSSDDSAETLDFAEILLGLRDDFASFRAETRRELRAIRTSTDLACKQLKNLGTRVTALEGRHGQIESDMLALASGTPPPMDFDDADEEGPEVAR